MDLDSDYCSNDSDGNPQNSSRTPTPPFIKIQSLDHRNILKKPIHGEHLISFVVGKQEEILEISDKELVALCKSCAGIARLVVTSKQSNTGTGYLRIKVPQWDPRVFKIFITYLKTDEIKPEDLKDFEEIIMLCMAYNVPKLLGEACSIAKQNISLENCVEIYNLGAMHDLEDLRVTAFNYMLKMGNSFVEHASFLELDCIALSILTFSDDLACVEITLFKRLKEWVKAQCTRLGYPSDRKEFFGRVAGLLFQHVRCAQMTPKEFRTEVVPSGLISQKDIEGINLRHRTHPNLWYALPPHPFVDRPRMIKLQFAVPLYNNVQIGFRKIAGASTTIQESVRFMVSHDIYLTSIGFFGPARSDRCTNSSPLTPYAIKIHVQGDYSKYYCRCPPQNATVLTRDNFSVDLSNPFQIQRLQPYKLTVWIDGDVSQFGVFPLPQAAVLMQDKGELITFHFGDADSDPQPILDVSGGSTSSAPLFVQPNFANRPPQFKQEPRISGVIRCISFVVRDDEIRD